MKAIWNKVKENPLLSILSVLLIALGVIFLVVMFSDCPKWIFNRLGIARTEEPKYEALKFLGIGMGGLLIALQALMSYRRAKAMEDAVEKTEQGQRQDRLKNAIEHLGHESDSVRLGGAYELFHLAKDTEDLSQTVLDILCAHIRRTTGESEYRKKHKSKPSEEVQSLLTLLFVHYRGVFKDHSIELQGSWLNGADLLLSQMQGANLIKAHLQGATFFKARLKRANLFDARLQGATFFKARLRGADLSEAHLQGADLSNAHLQGADLSNAYLQGTDLSKAHLQGANLSKANAYLQGTNLSKAHLQGADLSEAHLQGADLSNAYLQGTDLSKAHLQGADLSNAYLQGTNLSEAHLQGVQSQEQDYLSFSQRMEKSIGKESDLSGVIFSGGLSQEDVDLLVKNLDDEEAKKLREKLTPHIGQPENNQLPQESGAITGSYTKEEAEEWITEYEKAMSEVPEDDS